LQKRAILMQSVKAFAVDTLALGAPNAAVAYSLNGSKGRT